MQYEADRFDCLGLLIHWVVRAACYLTVIQRGFSCALTIKVGYHRSFFQNNLVWGNRITKILQCVMFCPLQNFVSRSLKRYIFGEISSNYGKWTRFYKFPNTHVLCISSTIFYTRIRVDGGHIILTPRSSDTFNMIPFDDVRARSWNMNAKRRNRKKIATWSECERIIY